MGKTATAALSGEANLAGVDRAIKDRAAALEALRRMNEVRGESEAQGEVRRVAEGDGTRRTRRPGLRP